MSSKKAAPSRKASSRTAATSRKASSKKSGGPTTDHDEIRKWVEARGGFPARVKQTGRGKDPGVLRIDYPGYSGQQTLERVDWDEFFEWFDRDKLAFVYQNKPNSRFSKLVRR